MKKRLSELPLRSGVGIVVLNKQNKVFVAKRIDNPNDYWQMPQGGVDKNENYFANGILFFLRCTGREKLIIIGEK